MITYQAASNSDIKSLAILLEENEMGYRDSAALKQSLQHSLFTIAAMDGKQLVGFGRVISDGEYYAFICDLVVHREYQAKGIGTCLVQKILDRLAPYTFRMVGLFTMEKNRSFYEHLGFVWSEDIHAMKFKQPAQK